MSGSESEKLDVPGELQSKIIREILKMDQMRKPEKRFISRPLQVGEAAEAKGLNLAVGKPVLFVIPPALDRYGLDLTQDKEMPSHFKVCFKSVASRLDLYVLPNGVIGAPASQTRAFHYFYDRSKNFRILVDDLEAIASRAIEQADMEKNEKPASGMKEKPPRPGLIS